MAQIGSYVLLLALALSAYSFLAGTIALVRRDRGSERMGETARRAGIATCAVTWGYGEIEELARHHPDFWIDAPHQLLPDY